MLFRSRACTHTRNQPTFLHVGEAFLQLVVDLGSEGEIIHKYHTVETVTLISDCRETVTLISHCRTVTLISHCRETVTLISHCRTVTLISHWCGWGGHEDQTVYLVLAILSFHSSDRKSPRSNCTRKKEVGVNVSTFF